MKGSDHEVDLARLERELTKDPQLDVWGLDPNGRPVVGATVTVEITELIPVRRLVGYDYNPITKLVEPRYEYDTQRKPLRTLTLTTRSGGAFGLTLTVPAADHDYSSSSVSISPVGHMRRRPPPGRRLTPDSGASRSSYRATGRATGRATR